MVAHVHEIWFDPPLILHVLVNKFEGLRNMPYPSDTLPAAVVQYSLGSFNDTVIHMIHHPLLCMCVHVCVCVHGCVGDVCVGRGSGIKPQFDGTQTPQSSYKHV